MTHRLIGALRSERKVDEIGKSLGIAREVQLGDADFDDAAYIETSEGDDTVRRALEDRSTRRHVLEVLALGYRVYMSPLGLCGTRVQYALDTFDPNPVAPVMRALEAMAPTLPVFDPSTLRRPRMRYLSIPVLVAFFVAIVGMVTIGAIPVLVTVPIDDMNSLRAFGYGLGLWVIAMVLFAFIVRGRPRALLELFFAGVLLLFGLPSYGAVGLFLYNTHADRVPVTTHTTTVTHVPHAGVTFESWNPHRRTYSAPMNFRRALEFTVGETIQVDTRPGALGWEYIAAVRHGSQ